MPVSTASHPDSGIRLLYVTTSNIDQARELARTLLDRKLIACANILPQMESVYRWEGEVRFESEAVLILKTEKRLVEAAQNAVLELHSYQTPCVLTLPIESGSQGYIDWLKNECR